METTIRSSGNDSVGISKVRDEVSKQWFTNARQIAGKQEDEWTAGVSHSGMQARQWSLALVDILNYGKAKKLVLELVVGRDPDLVCDHADPIHNCADQRPPLENK